MNAEQNKKIYKQHFEARLKLAFAGMNKNGFFEGLKCKKCNEPLQGERSGHPAESYAGTYTGLCYECQNSSSYVIETYANGAKLWSHPPHCPSWRRDREEFVAFNDCQECHHGRIMISRSYGQGGSYPEYCRSCMKKHCDFKQQEPTP